MNVLSLNLDKLKNTFQNILLLRNDVAKIKEQINAKIAHLKVSYGELSKHTTKKNLLFSLDSFFFQYKLFSVELENLNKTRILLNNRMYCDYYKLYILISTYIRENADDLNANEVEFRTYPVYKDLEPFQEYNLEDIKNMHSDIMKFVNYLHECYETNHEYVVNYNKKTRIGFSISNMLNTLEHENLILKQQMTLYVNYLSFFHISQTKHIKNLLDRMNSFNEEIEENISGNHVYSVDDVVEAEPLRKFDITETIHEDNINRDDIIQQCESGELSIPDNNHNKECNSKNGEPTTEPNTNNDSKSITEPKTKVENKPTSEPKTNHDSKSITELKNKVENKPISEPKTKVENKPTTEQIHHRTNPPQNQKLNQRINPL